MHNFGVYASTNTFEFSGEKPIVLIGGLNGRGKTTFLEAVLLALYGANSFAYQESAFKTYGQYLRSYVNISDGSKQTYVELEFKIDNIEKDCYLIRRNWNALNKVRTSEKITVYKNGVYNEFLTQNWAMFIENILPSALSNFFFFDGEKIAELAVDTTNAQLKESIRAMLGISVLDTLGNDLKRNIRRLQNSTNTLNGHNEVEKLRNKKDIAEQRLNEILSDISEKEDLLNQLNEKYEQKKIEYSSQGGDSIGKRENLLLEKARISENIQKSHEKLLALAAGELPLALVKDLLLKIAEQSENEKHAEVREQASNYINLMMRKYVQEKEGSEELSDFIEYIRQDSAFEVNSRIYQLSEHGLLQAKQLSDVGLQHIEEEATKELECARTFKRKEDEIDNYLAIDINEEELQKIYKEIKIYEAQISEVEAELVVLEQKRSSTNGELIKASSEFNKNVTALLSEMEADDDNKRAVKYAEMALRVLNEYSVRLQQRKTGILGETITSCYKKLANKKNLIDKIVMDPVTLDLKYLNSEGNEVEKTALSAGEKQLMVISILWSLAICSKKKLPVIIDTPLSRLDSNHRKALIQIYFPQASDQTIILSTDSEIDKRYYELMKDNVGDEFTLSYNDDEKSTTIQKGYFRGNDI